MLRPFLPAAAAWVPPVDLSRGAPVSHFGQRALERGVKSVPGDLLKWAIEQALAQGREDIICKVFDLCDAGSALYRVLLPDGVFYPVIRDGRTAATIYSADQARATRRARRDRLKTQGRRARRLADG